MEKRTPAILFLYTGGTIGSDKDNVEGRLVTYKAKPKHDEQLIALTRTIKSFYTSQFTQKGDETPEIIWEVMPRRHQIFSEDATESFWNALTEKLKEMGDQYFYYPSKALEGKGPSAAEIKEIYGKNGSIWEGARPQTPDDLFRAIRTKYFLGIVVLHGTDTMSYSTSITTFSLKRLPCPIVFTGANRPLRMLDEITWEHTKSDGWRNFTRAIHFLRILGHHLAEVFILFGDTVHHPIDTQKVPAEGIASAGDTLAEDRVEPFVYRNRGIHKQYAFKLIDGLICDNFYPAKGVGKDELLSWQELIDPNHSLYRHIVPDAFSAVGAKGSKNPSALVRMERERDSSCVRIIKIYPKMAPAILERQLRVLLVETYPTGASPSTKGHPFYKIWKRARSRGIPIYKVSSTGIPPGDTYGDLKDVTNLYSVTPESALALMSIIVSGIKDEEWKPATTPEQQLLKYRMDLINRRIDAHFRKRTLMTEIMGNITDASVRRQELVARAKASDDMHDRRRERLLVDSLKQMNNEVLTRLEETSRKAGDLAVALRSFGDYLYELYTNEYAYTVAGYTPDHFSLLYNLGFDIGWVIAEQATKTVRDDIFGGDKLFKDLSDIHKEELATCIREALKTAKRVLEVTRLARLTADAEQFVHPDVDEVLKISITIERRLSSFSIGKSDQRAVAWLQEPDIAWFEMVRNEMGQDSDEESFRANAAKGLDLRRKQVWSTKLYCYDWYLLGFTKGIVCACLGALRPDRWAARMGEDVVRDRELYRSAVSVRNLDSTGKYLKCDYIYTIGRREDERVG